MILNLRNLVKPDNQPLDSFTCHGVAFVSHKSTDHRMHEAGYQDRISGLDPQQDDIAYRQGYLEGILDELPEATDSEQEAWGILSKAPPEAEQVSVQTEASFTPYQISRKAYDRLAMASNARQAEDVFLSYAFHIPKDRRNAVWQAINSYPTEE